MQRVLKGRERSLPLNCNWVGAVTNRRKSISIWAGKRVSVPEAESVSASAGKESEEEKEQPVDSSLPTVLIVEDNKDLCNMLKLQLEDKFNIYMANDGVEGLKKSTSLSSRHGSHRPDDAEYGWNRDVATHPVKISKSVIFR